jgi:hypothetical protein
MDNSRSEIKSSNSECDPLPCLNSNISIENDENQQTDSAFNPVKLSTQHRKTAFILKESVQLISERFPLESIGFLTLTFAQHITCPKQAQKRLNSLISNVIKPRYHEYLGVMERQKSGRIHYHLLIAMDIDIRTGFNFDEVSDNNYSSVSKNLRNEWSFWRSTAPKYGFGRTELLPVKSNIEAMAKYVGKYIAKHVESRVEEDKGARLVRYSRGARAGTTRFQFQSEGSKEWRRKMAIFAQIVQHRHPDKKINTISDLTEVLGKKWAYHHRDYILALP